MTDLPAPLVPAEVDLRTFDDMPLDVRALRDSDTAADASDEAFRAAVMLWCAAWHQIPAASLPNDDTKLARLAGYGRDMRGWKRVREQALNGFQLCSDGRMYHTFMAKKALKAWSKKNEQKRKIQERWKEHNPRKNKKTAHTAVCSTVDTAVVPRNNRGNTGEVPLNRGDLSPPKSPPSSTAGSVRVPSDPTAQPSTNTDPYSHGFLDKQNRVVVHQPDGVILKISETGAVDLIAHDREAVIPQLTTEQALELRASTLRHISEPVAKVLAAAKPESFDPIRDMPACLRRAQSLA